MTVVLTVFMAVNMGLSALALARYDARTSGLAPANRLDVFLDEHFDNARMERVYPNAKKPADPAAINAKSTAPARFWGSAVLLVCSALTERQRPLPRPCP